MHAVDGAQAPHRTAARRLARHAEVAEGALLVDMPALQAQRALVAEAARLALLDDQRADQPAAELFAAGGVRVVPEAAGIRHAEAVVEVLAGQHRQLRHVGHAVHLQRQADAVPVDGARLGQLVDEAHPQPVALAGAQLEARRLAAVGPGAGLVPGHQLDVQRRGDQLVVVGSGLGRPPQPVARAATGEAEHAETGQAGEHLSAGEGHRAS
ncbi:hypothetical protein D3C86_1384120 [compost metagenome]